MVEAKRSIVELLLERGLAENEAEARALVMRGQIFEISAQGARNRVDKAGTRLSPAVLLERAGAPHPYVSRGGLKLAGALDALALDPAGLVAADIGVSTGGFSDCLLQRGALRIHAVDVGYGQIAWKLRGDPRIRLYERTHARDLTRATFGEPVQLLVADLSFIGLTPLLETLCALCAADAWLILLVKPQFEAPREDVGPGGIVTDPEARARALERVAHKAAELGLREAGRVVSPIKGDKGNVEILLALRTPEGTDQTQSRPQE